MFRYRPPPARAPPLTFQSVELGTEVPYPVCGHVMVASVVSTFGIRESAPNRIALRCERPPPFSVIEDPPSSITMLSPPLVVSAI